MNYHHYILLIDCPDEKGLVYKITKILYEYQFNIINNDEFVDRESNHFFMRTEFAGNTDESALLRELYTNMPVTATIRLVAKRRKNIVVLVTKEHHCLGELLLKHHFGDINANIMAVIGNYDKLQELTNRFSVPYKTVSHEGLSREEHEAEICRQISLYSPDFVVLAKYMRVLTPAFVAQYPHRIINIHHSFLPAFVGANPYLQAHKRGVKIIGATAHFVNDNLDEGPIIAQHVIPVDHTHTAADMAQAGRDVEKLTLSHALKLVFDDRVFVSGNKTVIFN
jgi:formyltetrahydrofolate deformylase